MSSSCNNEMYKKDYSNALQPRICALSKYIIQHMTPSSLMHCCDENQKLKLCVHVHERNVQPSQFHRNHHIKKKKKITIPPGFDLFLKTTISQNFLQNSSIYTLFTATRHLCLTGFFSRRGTLTSDPTFTRTGLNYESHLTTFLK